MNGHPLTESAQAKNSCRIYDMREVISRSRKWGCQALSAGAIRRSAANPLSTNHDLSPGWGRRRAENPAMGIIAFVTRERNDQHVGGFARREAARFLFPTKRLSAVQ